MRAKKVLELLDITRPTLSKYSKEKRINYIVKPNGQYDYNEDDVYKIFNKNIPREIIIYGRVSTSKQKKDLKNQIQLLKYYCFSRGYRISNIYQDIASGINFEKRSDFFRMLDDIIKGKIDRVVITYKDRLSRIGFNLFVYLFKQYGTKIEVMSEIGDEKLDSQEIFEEIVSLLHCYSMKLYSKRRNKKIIIEEK